MLSDPPTLLAEFPEVLEKSPTMVTAGTIVQSLSPHQRDYIIGPGHDSAPKGTAAGGNEGKRGPILRAGKQITLMV